jgi:hypothetical protein
MTDSRLSFNGLKTDSNGSFIAKIEQLTDMAAFSTLLENVDEAGIEAEAEADFNQQFYFYQSQK